MDRHTCWVSAENEAGTSEETTPSELITPERVRSFSLRGLRPPSKTFQIIMVKALYLVQRRPYSMPQNRPVDVGLL